MAHDSLTGRDEFDRLCRENGLHFEQTRVDLLERYVERLLDWNRRVNLVSRRDAGNIWVSHILHAISPLFFLALPSGLRVLDLGTGGGLPGVPIAVVRDDLALTLLDSIRKKTAALEDIVAGLGIANVQVVTGRAEAVGREKSQAGRYDLVVARAVAPLHELIRWSRLFLRSEGPESSWRPCLVAMKGGDLDDELRVARLRTGVREVEVIPLGLRGAGELAGKVAVVARG